MKDLKTQIDEMTEQQAKDELFKVVKDASQINADNVKMVAANKALREKLEEKNKKIAELEGKAEKKIIQLN